MQKVATPQGLTPHQIRSLVGCSPNAGPELRLEAGARHERTLEAVSSRPMFGADSASRLEGCSRPTPGFLKPGIGPAHRLRVCVPLLPSACSISELGRRPAPPPDNGVCHAGHADHLFHVMHADHVHPFHDRYGHGGCRPFDPVVRW